MGANCGVGASDILVTLLEMQGARELNLVVNSVSEPRGPEARRGAAAAPPRPPPITR